MGKNSKQNNYIINHTFRLGTYEVEIVKSIGGICDTPSEGNSWEKEKKTMLITNKKGLSGLEIALHEGMHAEGIPDEYIHTKDGESDTSRLSRFLWRLGYRKIKSKMK